MHFVDDQQVESARVGVGIGGQHLAEQTHGPWALQPVDRDDETGKHAERVGTQPSRTAQVTQHLGVDDAEVEAELLGHFGLPFQAQRCGAGNEHGAGTVTEQEFLDHQSCLDRLPQADVIGDEQIDPRHPQCPHHRVELVVLNLDAGPEGRLKRTGIDRGHGPPPDCVEERCQAVGVVEPAFFGLWQGRGLENLGARLDLPDDLEVIGVSVVFDGNQRHEMLHPGVGSRHLICWYGASEDVGHYPMSIADNDELSLFGNAYVLCDRHGALRLVDTYCRCGVSQSEEPSDAGGKSASTAGHRLE